MTTQQETSDWPTIWVGCLKSYNAGELRGKWIDLSSDSDVVWEEINEILAETGGEEWQVFDSENLPSFLTGAHPDIDQLAEYTESLEQYLAEGGEAEIYRAVCDDWHEIVAADRIYTYGAANDAAAVGVAVAESFGESELLDALPGGIYAYIDWQKVGNTLLADRFEIIDGVAVEVEEA
jgi:antirestriction protein